MEINQNAILSAISFVASACVSYGVLLNKSRDLNNENEKVWAEIGKMRINIASIEKSASEKEIGMLKEIGFLRESIASSATQFVEIIRWLERIDAKLGQIEGTRAK